MRTEMGWPPAVAVVAVFAAAPASPRNVWSTSTTGPTISTTRSSRSSPRRPASRSSTTSSIPTRSLETKLLAGGSGYDVVVPTGPFMPRQIKAGVFQKLDKSKLPNLSNMWPMSCRARGHATIPATSTAVNYMWGTTGIGYNVDKVKAALGDVPLDSWDVAVRPGERGEAQGLRHLHPRCARGHRSRSR